MNIRVNRKLPTENTMDKRVAQYYGDFESEVVATTNMTGDSHAAKTT